MIGFFAAGAMGSGGGGVTPSGVTWDPGHTSPVAVLSLGNLRLTADTGATGTYASTRSTAPIMGLCYVSGTVRTTGGGATAAYGLADATIDLTDASRWAGETSASVGVYAQNGNIYSGGSLIGSVGALSSPDDIQIAVRVATRRIWIRQAGGAWVGGGDPAEDTSPTLTLGGSGDIYVAATVNKASATPDRYSQLHPDAGSTTGAVPSGFTAASFAP